jgi:hypothetical protein
MVCVHVGFRQLQRPRAVLDVSTKQAAAVGRSGAPSPMFQAGFGPKHRCSHGSDALGVARFDERRLAYFEPAIGLLDRDGRAWSRRNQARATRTAANGASGAEPYPRIPPQVTYANVEF